MASADDSMLDDEILTLFVEDTKEHLSGIESSLMDMERSDGDPDPELVNTVFRAAHSIKGGAGFLNLNNIRDLAHKLENVLHMIRNKEITPDNRVISKLLSGFDKLLSLVEHVEESDSQDISGHISELAGLTEELLPEQEKGSQDKTVDIGLPDGRAVFCEDALTISQALKGGHFLYLVEYDLIHDVHAQKKTPLDVIKAMESSGLIVDCKVDVAAVGDLDAPPTNKIPFYVLFSTIVEPDIISYLFAISPDRIHRLDLEAAALTPPGQPSAASGQPFSQTVGVFTVTGTDETAALAVGRALTADTAADLRLALLAALEKTRETVLDVSAVAEADLAGLQLLCSAAKTYAAQGRKITLAPGGTGVLSAAAARFGLSGDVSFSPASGLILS